MWSCVLAHFQVMQLTVPLCVATMIYMGGSYPDLFRSPAQQQVFLFAGDLQQRQHLQVPHPEVHRLGRVLPLVRCHRRPRAGRSGRKRRFRKLPGQQISVGHRTPRRISSARRMGRRTQARRIRSLLFIR